MLIVNALIEKQHFAESAQSLIANMEIETKRQEGRKKEENSYPGRRG